MTYSRRTIYEEDIYTICHECGLESFTSVKEIVQILKDKGYDVREWEG